MEMTLYGARGGGSAPIEAALVLADGSVMTESAAILIHLGSTLDADDASDVHLCIQRGAWHRLHLYWGMFADQFLPPASLFEHHWPTHAA